MNRLLLCLLLAITVTACNPLPPTPDEEDKAAQAKAQAAAQAKPTATPRKPGDWIYDNKKDRLQMNDKDKQGKPADPLNFNTKLKMDGGSTPRKDGKYNNPLDKTPGTAK
jgi:hypothetical protein